MASGWASGWLVGWAAVGVAAVASSLALRPAPPAGPDPANRGAIGLPDVEGGYASTHILVRLRDASLTPLRRADGSWTFTSAKGLPKATRLAADSVARTLAAAKASGVAALFPNLADGAAATRLGLDRVYRISVPIGTDTPALVRALATQTRLFDRVELDGIGGLAADLPNDPQLPNQYAFHNVGQTIGGVPGVEDADVDAPEAWELALSRGLDTSTVTVAVLDSGINQHGQLAGRVLPGFNIPDGTTLTVDECSSHGTHVSGIIAATGNDATGSIGMAWQAKLLPYVVVNGCNGFESSLATALTLATDAGLRLANMSLQYSTGTQTLRDAVLYAYEHDVIMVAAAGNNNSPSVAFPGRWPETICVAAITNTNAKAGFSNFGNEVDLCAGGQDVRSLIGTASYGDKSGTSQATPAVTGTIALMLAWNPNLTPDEVRQILIDTADDIGPPGFDTSFGYGRLNAFAALAATPSATPEDLNGDGAVNASDLAILLGAWGACADCDGGCAADLDGNCDVGPPDLAILLGAWS